MSLVEEDNPAARGGSSDQGVVLSIRPLDPDTAVRVGVVELRRCDFPFHFGRKRTHGHNGAEHWDRQELRLADTKPLQLSRDHCSLEIRDNRIVVHDRASTLGTVINSQILGRHSGTFVAILSEGTYELILGNLHSHHRFELEVRALD